jgi:hypothetical protein
VPKCRDCGEEIIFRYVDGELKPIHLKGGRCSGSYSGRRSQSSQPKTETSQVAVGRMTEIAAYVNPNAKCPVCSRPVFYYQNEHGSRVFFNELGWPWEKHPCTDNNEAKKQIVFALNSNAQMQSQTSMLDMIACSLFDAIWDTGEGGKSPSLLLSLYRPPRGLRERVAALVGTKHIFRLEIMRRELETASVNIQDFQNAPCIVLPASTDVGDRTKLWFISGRLAKMIEVSGHVFGK